VYALSRDSSAADAPPSQHRRAERGDQRRRFRQFIPGHAVYQRLFFGRVDRKADTKRGVEMVALAHLSIMHVPHLDQSGPSRYQAGKPKAGWRGKGPYDVRLRSFPLLQRRRPDQKHRRHLQILSPRNLSPQQRQPQNNARHAL